MNEQRALIPSPSHEATQRPEDRGVRPPEGDPPPRRRVILYVLIPLAVLLALGAWSHWQTYAAAADASNQQKSFVPEVRTAQAQRVNTPVALTLPGQTEAFDAANVFARATGYIAERRVDIGSRVKKGDLLVRIAAPDLDQQLFQAQAQLGQTQAAILQAQANLQQAQANKKLGNVTKYRETTLASQGWETKQNADNSVANAATQVANVASAQAGIAVAVANLHAQQATVDRLKELTGFERVTAPFNGVITARSVDTGDLVNADSSGGSPLFSIARADVLRVAVYVPQSSAVGLHDGVAAQVRLPELPNQVFTGRVNRTADSLQPGSRSMLTEVDVANPDGVLRAGLYVDVTFQIPRLHPGIVVPDEALVFGPNGMQVAEVQGNGTVQMRDVSIYRDFGTSAELRGGLSGGETLILSPPTDLRQGMKVDAAKSGGGKPSA